MTLPPEDTTQPVVARPGELVRTFGQPDLAVSAPAAPLLPAPDISILTPEAIEAAEQRIGALKKVKLIALKVTSPGDWTDISGTPYLNSSGVDKVARLFGITLRLKPMEVRRFEDEMGGLVEQYIAIAVASMQGGEVEEIGTAATDDEFFATEHMPSGQRVQKPFSEVDIASVRKKAVTNAYSRAVKKLLGLGGLRWEDIEEAVDRSEVKGFKHRGRAPASERSGRQSTELPAEAKDPAWCRGEVRRLCLVMAGGKEQEARAIYARLAGFMGRDGKWQAAPEHPARLSDKAAPVVYGKVQKAHDAWQANRPAPGANADERAGDGEAAF